MNKSIYTSLLLSVIATPVAAELEEVIVNAKQIKHVYLLQDEQTIQPDTSQLLKKVPGGNVNGNGPLSGIPQYRGLYGERIGVLVNGAKIASAGPNSMDPPLSYAAPAQLVKVEIFRGIAPVSVTQESIGGAISSHTKSAEFRTNEKYVSSGQASITTQSINDAFLANATISLSNHNNYLSVAAMSEQANDAEFSAGVLLATEYERQRAELKLGHQLGDHSFELSYARNQTGHAGTPALPMDIDYFDGDLLNFGYSYDGKHWDVDGKLYSSALDHGMNNFSIRSAPTNEMLWRRNTTSADSYGASLQALHSTERNNWQFGVDYFFESHDSRIDNPNNPMFFVQNFNQAEREVYGVFAELERKLSQNAQLDLGLRVNHVRMSSGAVDASPAMTMPPARSLRDDFNNGQPKSDDTNIDAVAKIWLRQNDLLSWYFGIGHKTRSPSYIERFLWLPLQSTGGLSDGLTYTGNLDLRPEQSNEIELGFDFNSDRFYFSPRVFHRRINDYIQGTPNPKPAATMFVQMQNRNSGGTNPAPLQFNNVDAVVFGADLDWRIQLNSNWHLDGILSYVRGDHIRRDHFRGDHVRGEHNDIDDYLYRIAPLNFTTRLHFEKENWGGSIEWVWYDDQNKVSDTNLEQATEGYQLFHLNGWYRFSDAFRLGFGVQNLTDEIYQDHLTGYNRVLNPDVPIGARLPGYGRNFFLNVDLRW